MNEIIKKAEAHGRKLRLKVMSLALPEIREKGWEALVQALGYAGATKFILLYEKRKGNYTKEKKADF